MSRYVEWIEDKNGDAVDVNYYCSYHCYLDHNGKSPVGCELPSTPETDYPVYCANPPCEIKLWKGLQDV